MIFSIISVGLLLYILYKIIHVIILKKNAHVICLQLQGRPSSYKPYCMQWRIQGANPDMPAIHFRYRLPPPTKKSSRDTGKIKLAPLTECIDVAPCRVSRSASDCISFFL